MRNLILIAALIGLWVYLRRSAPTPTPNGGKAATGNSYGIAGPGWLIEDWYTVPPKKESKITPTYYFNPLPGYQTAGLPVASAGGLRSL